jgi:hypothetical protein
MTVRVRKVGYIGNFRKGGDAITIIYPSSPSVQILGLGLKYQLYGRMGLVIDA